MDVLPRAVKPSVTNPDAPRTWRELTDARTVSDLIQDRLGAARASITVDLEDDLAEVDLDVGFDVYGSTRGHENPSDMHLIS